MGVQITLNGRWPSEPRSTSTSSSKASSPSRSLASTSRDSTSDHAPTTVTPSWHRQQTSFARPTCQKARLAPSLLHPESTVVATPSQLDPSSPSPTSSSPSSRAQSGPRQQSPTPPVQLLLASSSGPLSTTKLLTLY